MFYEFIYGLGRIVELAARRYKELSIQSFSITNLLFPNFLSCKNIGGCCPNVHNVTYALHAVVRFCFPNSTYPLNTKYRRKKFNQPQPIWSVYGSRLCMVWLRSIYRRGVKRHTAVELYHTFENEVINLSMRR